VGGIWIFPVLLRVFLLFLIYFTHTKEKCPDKFEPPLLYQVTQRQFWALNFLKKKVYSSDDSLLIISTQ